MRGYGPPPRACRVFVTLGECELEFALFLKEARNAGFFKKWPLLKCSSNYLKIPSERYEVWCGPDSGWFWSPGKQVVSAYCVVH